MIVKNHGLRGSLFQQFNDRLEIEELFKAGILKYPGSSKKIAVRPENEKMFTIRMDVADRQPIIEIEKKFKMKDPL